MTKRHRHRIILQDIWHSSRHWRCYMLPVHHEKKKRERWFTFTLNQLWFIFDNIYRAGDYRSRRIGAQQTLTQIWKRQINQLRTSVGQIDWKLHYFIRRLKVNCAVTFDAIGILFYFIIFLNRARGYLNAFVGVFRAWRINATVARKGKVNTQLSVNPTSNLAVWSAARQLDNCFHFRDSKGKNLF